MIIIKRQQCVNNKKDTVCVRVKKIESMQHTQQYSGMNIVSSYLKYSTTATKPCMYTAFSASSASAVWLHGLSLHIC